MKKKVLTESTFSALDAELQDEEIGFNPRPVRVKISHPSALFEIPGLSNVDDLEVVVLAASRVRVFFPNMGTDATTKTLTEFTNKRPFCSSNDYANGKLCDVDWSDNPPDPADMLRGKIAEGALVCAQCPLNKWESIVLLGKTGRGKACNELRKLCLWKSGWQVPVILSIPSSSIRSWDDYCSSLIVGNYRIHHVVTKMSLESISTAGRNYSVVKFRFKDVVNPEMQEELLTPVNLRGKTQSLIKALVDIFKSRKLEEEDYPVNGNGKTDEDDLKEDF